MNKLYYLICTIFLLPNIVFAQIRKDTIPLINNKDLSSINVIVNEEFYLGKKSLKVTDNGVNTEVKFAKINNLNKIYMYEK
jgi:hypothetical protein